jgi:hypothetical protein
MDTIPPTAVTKTHPATREILPEDPLEMHAVEVDGDTELMLRLLVEEYARMGWDADQILELSRDPNYLTFHALWRMIGENDMRQRLRQIVSRCGVVRVTAVERPAEPEQLVTLRIPGNKSERS